MVDTKKARSLPHKLVFTVGVAFSGVRRYQLLDAAADLHAPLAGAIPLVRRWIPSPLGRSQVDVAIRRVLPSGADDFPPSEFRAFAADLFRDAVLAGAGRALLLRMPIGAVGILGIGATTRAGAEVVARVMAVYAVGVAAVMYLSLS